MRHAILSSVLVLGLVHQVDAQQIVAGGPVAPDGATEVAVDFPQHQKLQNCGGTDGAGLCVFTSIAHSARWQNERRLVDFQEKMKNERGGGWPEKVDAMIDKYAKGAQYLQYVGTDLAILKAALRSGRPVAVTYNGHDGVLYRGYVSHMVNLIHLDEKWACVMDNNYIGERQLLWLPVAEFSKRWTGGGQGWAVFLLSPPPPPPPTLQGGEAQPRQFMPAGKLPPAPRAPKFYQWSTLPDDPDRRYLWLENELLGAWDLTEHYWRSRSGQGWGPTLKHAPHEPPRETTCVVHNYGVERHRFPAGEVFLFCGKACTRREALASLITDKDLPDDVNRLRLTIIGEEGFRRNVLEDLASAPALAGWKDKLVVQDYPSGHWAVSGLGFPAQGIVVQQPPGPDGRGKVLHQQLHYRGPEEMSEALRKADDKYIMPKAPDLTKEGMSLLRELPWEFVGICVGVVAIVLLSRRPTHVHG